MYTKTTRPTADDWATLNDLAAQAGLPVRQVAVVRSLVGDGPGTVGPSRPGSPYTLLVGRSDCGIEELVPHLLGNSSLLLAAGSITVVGPDPQRVAPRLSGWKLQQSVAGESSESHSIIAVPHGRPSPDLLASLQYLGWVEHAVLVVRLSQAMHEEERLWATALAPLAAVATLVMVGTLGEDIPPSEIEGIRTSALRRLEKRGFAGRIADCVVWFPRPQEMPFEQTTDELRRALAIDPEAVAAGKPGMAQAALSQLVSRIELALAQKQPTTSRSAGRVATEKINDMASQLEGFLAKLGGELERSLEARPDASSEILRARTLQALNGWRAYIDPPGFWLEHAEKLRPGSQAAFLEEASAAAPLLTWLPGVRPQTVPSAPQPSADPSLTMIIAVRLGATILLGALGAGLMTLVFGSQPAPVPNILAVAGLIMGALVGFVLSGYGVAAWGERNAATEEPAPPPEIPRDPELAGWDDYSRRLIVQFRSFMGDVDEDPREQLKRLEANLGLEKG